MIKTWRGVCSLLFSLKTEIILAVFQNASDGDNETVILSVGSNGDEL
jgi:hypothetical protein